MKLLAIAADVGELPTKGMGFGRLAHASGLDVFTDVVISASAPETAAALEVLSYLAQSGKRVVLVSDDRREDIRAQAFGAGALDVVQGSFPDDVIGAVLRTRLRAVEPRLFVPVQAGAKLFGPAGALQALITDVSALGFHARVDQRLAPGTVVRVQAMGSDLPPLFARVQEATGDALIAAFTGMLPEERERLAWFLGTLDATLDGGEQRLVRIGELRCEHLLVRGGVLPGAPPLPPLMDVEREALSAPGPERESNPVAWIALARMRAHALAAALGDPAVPRDTAIEGATHREVVAAEGLARETAAAALTAGAVERNRALAELHRRVALAVEALERVAKPTDDTTRRQPLVTAEGAAVAFRAPGETSSPVPPVTPPPKAAPAAWPPASRSASMLRLAALGAVAVALLAVTAWRVLFAGGAGESASSAALALSTRAPLETVRGVRVEKIYRLDGAVIAIVDGTWFQADMDAREAALRELAAKHAQGARFAFRDAIGREVAWIDSAGNGFYVPDPDKTYEAAAAGQ